MSKGNQPKVSPKTRSKTQSKTPSKAKSKCQPQKKRSIETVREWIGLITAGAGIFVALLYLAGHRFVQGYLVAINIPPSLYKLSTWEYAEIAWFPAVFYSSLMLSFIGMIAVFIFESLDAKKESINNNLSLLKTNINQNQRRAILVGILSMSTFLVAILVTFSLYFLELWGKDTGGQLLLQDKVSKVELVSAVPMALDDDNLLPEKASGQDYYIYKDLYLLGTNNGKYYLFKELNPQTCTPIRTYVVSDNPNTQVNFLPEVSLKDHCDPVEPFNIVTFISALIPTPTPTPTAASTPTATPTLIQTPTP